MATSSCAVMHQEDRPATLSSDCTRHMPRRTVVHGLLSAALALSWGCVNFDVEEIASPEAKQGRRPSVLMVFVTGFGDKPEKVREHRVLETLETCVGPIDTIIVYHEAMEYLTGSFSAELHRRVTRNPRYRRYERRILVGFSSGGTAALDYATRYADAFDALILYAPFLGPSYVIKEIDAAGGLAHWTPQGPVEPPERLWLWLRQYAAGEISNPPTYQLWSRGDDIAPGLSLLEGHIPADRMVISDEGQHGWEAFNQLWPTFVADHTKLFTSRKPPPACREQANRRPALPITDRAKRDTPEKE
jgi:pimeloyl-ACP methyl ester carboxylesterase